MFAPTTSSKQPLSNRTRMSRVCHRYLQREESAVAERFEYLDQKMKMKKAMEMFQVRSRRVCGILKEIRKKKKQGTTL